MPSLGNRSEGTLRHVLDSLLGEVIRANATAGVHQRLLLAEAAASLPSIAGVSLAEDLGQFASLGLHELTLTLWLEEVRPSLCDRLFRPARAKQKRYRLVRPGVGHSRAPALVLKVTIKQTKQGTYQWEYVPGTAGTLEAS